MPIPNEINFIPLSRSLARYIITRGAQLVSDGIGREWRPEDNSYVIGDGDSQGFLDDIPMEEGSLWYWANAMVQMLRLIVANLNQLELETSSEDPSSVLESID